MELTHEQHDKYHSMAVWRGFVALAALIIFFLFEKLINIVGDYRENKKRERDLLRFD